jgi:beta-N-acetylhexosaminidase
MAEQSKALKEIIDRLTLEEKIGATLTMHYKGTVFLPILEDIIMTYHIGGLRLVPGHRNAEPFIDCLGQRGIFSVPQENEELKRYSLTNLRHLHKRMQEMAVSRNGVPLHMSFDCEGEFSGEFKGGGAPLFPPPMGLVASGDPNLAYEVALAVSRIARSICANMIHSPCLDVNVDPRNPEINTRAYSDVPEKVAEYALQSCRGFRDGGVIAAAKHFPGRGNSSVDAHHVVPVIDIDADTFWNVDLYPYRVLVEQGVLPAIMTAHSIYPAIDPDNVATLSPKILQGIVREKMGFDGIITSDAIGMNGITLDYSVAEGTARALEAGCDMVLLRMSTSEPIVTKLPEVVSTIRQYVESGRIPEKDLDQKVYRILKAKQDIGLLENPVDWTEEVDQVLVDPEIVEVYNRASTKNICIARSEEGALPLAKGVKALVVEQTFVPFLCSNDDACPPGVLYDSLLRYSHNLSYFELTIEEDASREEQLLEVVSDFDTIIISNWSRRSAGSVNGLIERIAARHTGRLIVVANTPYEAFSIPRVVKNAIVHFGMTPKSVETVADILFGAKEAEGTWPIAYQPPAMG